MKSRVIFHMKSILLISFTTWKASVVTHGRIKCARNSIVSDGGFQTSDETNVRKQWFSSSTNVLSYIDFIYHFARRFPFHTSIRYSDALIVNNTNFSRDRQQLDRKWRNCQRFDWCSIEINNAATRRFSFVQRVTDSSTSRTNSSQRYK